MNIARPVILHVVNALRPSDGGPSRTVPGLAAAVAETGRFEVVILTTSSAAEPNVTIRGTGVDLVQFPWTGRSWSPRLARKLNVEICKLHQRRPLSLIHDHGMWLASNHAAAVAGRRLKLPRICSPRGMLSPWARSHHRRRKQLFWFTHARRDLFAASRIHATSGLERDELRELGLNLPIDLVPNGIDVPASLAPVTRDVHPRTALFLSRIHPKKGVAELISAWSRLRPANWRLVIAGADDGGHLPALRQQVLSAGLEDQVSFPGPIDGPEKWNLYQRASLFVLPSHSENFGLVVGEALACGTPVITTRATPWEILQTHGCGWWIETGVEPLTAALRQTFDHAGDLEEMGARGRNLVRERFTWSAVGAQMADVYDRTLSEAAAAAR